MLTVYTLDQASEWDAIVRTFSEYDTYWLSGYVRAFHLHGDGTPLLFHYDNGGVRGINVVMRRDIASDRRFGSKLSEDTYFDFATPYGYGGWLIEGSDTTSLFETYEAWCKKNRIISEFVRFHPVLKNHRAAVNAYEVIALGKTVTMDLRSPEIIWENLTSQNRNKIRKAQKKRHTHIQRQVCFGLRYISHDI